RALVADLVQQPQRAPQPRDPPPHRQRRHLPQPRRHRPPRRRRPRRADRRMGRRPPLPRPRHPRQVPPAPASRHRPRGGDRQHPRTQRLTQHRRITRQLHHYRGLDPANCRPPSEQNLITTWTTGRRTRLTPPVQRPRNPMISTLLNLRGNGRASVYTEPMWGLSMMLVLPYASVFMLALGVYDTQIGLLATISTLSQVVFGLLSGVITDKLGRRRTTAIFDVIAWAVPCLVWAFAQNFWWFLAASVINGAWQVTQNSWDCLLVEDVD